MKAKIATIEVDTSKPVNLGSNRDEVHHVKVRVNEKVVATAMTDFTALKYAQAIELAFCTVGVESERKGW